MKCQTEGCLKQAQENQLLCARCVRLVPGSPKARSESSSLFEPMAESSSTEPGEQFLPLSENGFGESKPTGKNMPMMKNLEIVKMQQESSISKSTEERSGLGSRQSKEPFSLPKELPITEETSSAMKNKDGGTTFEEPKDLQIFTPQETEETLPESSTERLLNAEEERLASMSLIDDCTARLRLQMHRLTLRADGAPKDPIGHSHSERQRVGLAIKTASEIGKLIRLKLDAVKIFKELEK